MKRIIAVLTIILFLPVHCLAEEEERVSIVRKKCYPAIFRVFCKGAVQNVSGEDIENVVIHFSSQYLKLHAPKVDTDAYDEIERLSPGETADFVVVWDTNEQSALIGPDILREYILMSVANGTMEVNIILKDMKEPAQGAPAPAQTEEQGASQVKPEP